MKLLERFKNHVPRVRHQLGRPLKIGTQSFRLQGYHADRLARDFDDEPHLLPVLKRVLSGQKGAFIDVGANVGQTLIKVLAIDPSRTYLGFEPQLESCFYVERFLQANSLANAHILPIALSNADGMVPLFWDQPNDTTASIFPSHAYAPGQRRPHMNWIPARVGDDLLREMGIEDVAAIKIDVEGYELEVLSGLLQTIRQKRPAVIFEVLSNYFWNKLVDEETRRTKSRRADTI